MCNMLERIGCRGALRVHFDDAALSSVAGKPRLLDARAPRKGVSLFFARGAGNCRQVEAAREHGRPSTCSDVM